VLIAQHNRGREITHYVLAVTGKGAIGTGDAEPLARVFDTMDLMYENHAAREDTIVFQAWKDALSASQLREINEKFEDIDGALNSSGHDCGGRMEKTCNHKENQSFFALAACRTRVSGVDGPA
jgi:hemerythrin-like domain-containing protein